MVVVLEPESSDVLVVVEASSPDPPLEPPEEVVDGDPEEELLPEELPPGEFKPDPLDPELDPFELPPSLVPDAVDPEEPLLETNGFPISPAPGGLPPAAQAEARPSPTKPIPILHARIAPTG